MPSERRMTLSNCKKVSADGVWMVATTVRPRLLSFLRSFAMDRAAIESNPEVGSSNRTRLGLDMSSYPIEILFNSPFLTFDPI